VALTCGRAEEVQWVFYWKMKEVVVGEVVAWKKLAVKKKGEWVAWEKKRGELMLWKAEEEVAESGLWIAWERTLGEKELWTVK
jgi:hypothetical protein